MDEDTRALVDLLTDVAAEAREEAQTEFLARMDALARAERLEKQVVELRESVALKGDVIEGFKRDLAEADARLAENRSYIIELERELHTHKHPLQARL